MCINAHAKLRLVNVHHVFNQVISSAISVRVWYRCHSCVWYSW